MLIPPVMIQMMMKNFAVSARKKLPSVALICDLNMYVMTMKEPVMKRITIKRFGDNLYLSLPHYNILPCLDTQIFYSIQIQHSPPQTLLSLLAYFGKIGDFLLCFSDFNNLSPIPSKYFPKS